MSTPSDNPTPTPGPVPMSPLSGAPSGSAPKPAYKVTRSPFSPKITGNLPAAGAPAGMPGPGGGAMTIGASSAFETSAVPMARKSVSARASSGAAADVSAPLVLVDFVAAAVAIAGAVMIALQYFKQ